MLGFEEGWVLEGAVGWDLVSSGREKRGGTVPPTRVSWAPRRMALGSKLDILVVVKREEEE